MKFGFRSRKDGWVGRKCAAYFVVLAEEEQKTVRKMIESHLQANNDLLTTVLLSTKRGRILPSGKLRVESGEILVMI